MQLIKKNETRMLMLLLNPEQDNKDIFLYILCVINQKTKTRKTNH